MCCRVAGAPRPGIPRRHRAAVAASPPRAPDACRDGLAGRLASFPAEAERRPRQRRPWRHSDDRATRWRCARVRVAADRRAAFRSAPGLRPGKRPPTIHRCRPACPLAGGTAAERTEAKSRASPSYEGHLMTARPADSPCRQPVQRNPRSPGGRKPVQLNSTADHARTGRSS